MKILFHDNSLNNRGTSVAIYDYAYYNQKILGNESVITYNKNNMFNDVDVINKFKKEFNVIGYDQFSEINNIVIDEKIDVFYIIKSGEKNDQLVPGVKNIIHSVFNGDPTQKHGDVYATVSEWLSSLSNYEIPYVSHMINLPEINDNLRDELNIHEDQIVIGRYGGLETFDINFVYNSIRKILDIRNDITFLFMNTYEFISHPKVIFLPSSTDLTYKSKFINTCDSMIHARQQGESFGLSVLEFACKNKQIITYGLSPEKSHLLYLKNNCTIYNNENELDSIFKNISKTNPFDTSYLNDKFSPNAVMNIFKKIFINE